MFSLLLSIPFAMLVPEIAMAGPGQGRGLRVGAVDALLMDLARLEITNVERDDPGVQQSIQQHIQGARQKLLGAVEGSQPLQMALRGTLKHLRVITAFNQNGYYDDEQLLMKMAQQLEHMRARLEEMIQRTSDWSHPHVPPLQTPPWMHQQPPMIPPVQAPVYVPAPRPRPGRVQPMAGERFGVFLQRVRDASFADSQVGVIEDQMKSGAYFTCGQITQVMQAVTFPATQVRVAALMYPRAVDQDNFPDLISVLTFESHRQELRKLVNR